MFELLKINAEEKSGKQAEENELTYRRKTSRTRAVFSLEATEVERVRHNPLQVPKGENRQRDLRTPAARTSEPPRRFCGNNGEVTTGPEGEKTTDK